MFTICLVFVNAVQVTSRLVRCQGSPRMCRVRRKNSVTKRAGETGGGDSRRPVLTYIKGILASLNPTDRLIAECVLADPEKPYTNEQFAAAVEDVRKFERQRMDYVTEEATKALQQGP